jgi:hypothetical protein
MRHPDSDWVNAPQQHPTASIAKPTALLSQRLQPLAQRIVIAPPALVVLSAPVLQRNEVIANEQVVARELIVELDHPGEI